MSRVQDLMAVGSVTAFLLLFALADPAIAQRSQREQQQDNSRIPPGKTEYMGRTDCPDNALHRRGVVDSGYA